MSILFVDNGAFFSVAWRHLINLLWTGVQFLIRLPVQRRRKRFVTSVNTGRTPIRRYELSHRCFICQSVWLLKTATFKWQQVSMFCKELVLF